MTDTGKLSMPASTPPDQCRTMALIPEKQVWDTIIQKAPCQAADGVDHCVVDVLCMTRIV